jgi:hypothetical protein
MSISSNHTRLADPMVSLPFREVKFDISDRPVKKLEPAPVITIEEEPWFIVLSAQDKERIRMDIKNHGRIPPFKNARKKKAYIKNRYNIDVRYSPIP